MKKEMMLIIGMIAILAMVPSACADAIITDHTYTNLSEIPDEWVGEAKDNPPIAYQRTSRGSQLITGMRYLASPTGYSLNCPCNGE